MNLTDKEKALLNKIYRAVHDHVCPVCGHDMIETRSYGGFRGFRCDNGQCGFEVSDMEMSQMRGVVLEWGAEAVAFFRQWRERP